MRLGTLVTSVVMLMRDARTHPSALRCRNARDMHYDCEREAGAVLRWLHARCAAASLSKFCLGI